MKFSIASLLFVTVMLFIVIPEEGFADTKQEEPAPPNEEYFECGTWCENTCAKPRAQEGPCIMMCKRGYFCKSGYIREFEGGRCIRPSDCPSQQPHSE